MAVELDTNTSGQGAAATVPVEIKGWSWGAFLMNWAWAIGNHTYIGLLALVPLVQWVMMIVLGVKGNEWAWQNRRWDSVDQFKATQKVWTKWGVVIVIVNIAICLIYSAIVAIYFSSNVSPAKVVLPAAPR